MSPEEVHHREAMRLVRSNFAVIYLIVVATLCLLVFMWSYIHRNHIDAIRSRATQAAQTQAIHRGQIQNCQRIEAFKKSFAEVIRSRRRTLPSSGYYIHRPAELKQALKRNTAMLHALQPVDCNSLGLSGQSLRAPPNTGPTSLPTGAVESGLLQLLAQTETP